MGKTWRRRAVALLGCAFLGGCDSHDAEHLARVGRVAAAKLEAVAGNEKLWTGLKAVRGDLNQEGLDARVTARLRWDKALAETPIEVRAKEGEVELKGVVRNLEQRRRAVDLAESTAGAVKVKDLLEVKE